MNTSDEEVKSHYDTQDYFPLCFIMIGVICQIIKCEGFVHNSTGTQGRSLTVARGTIKTSSFKGKGLRENPQSCIQREWNVGILDGKTVLSKFSKFMYVRSNKYFYIELQIYLVSQIDCILDLLCA